MENLSLEDFEPYLQEQPENVLFGYIINNVRLRKLGFKVEETWLSAHNELKLTLTKEKPLTPNYAISLISTLALSSQPSPKISGEVKITIKSSHTDTSLDMVMESTERAIHETFVDIEEVQLKDGLEREGSNYEISFGYTHPVADLREAKRIFPQEAKTLDELIRRIRLWLPEFPEEGVTPLSWGKLIYEHAVSEVNKEFLCCNYTPRIAMEFQPTSLLFSKVMREHKGDEPIEVWTLKGVLTPTEFEIKPNIALEVYGEYTPLITIPASSEEYPSQKLLFCEFPELLVRIKVNGKYSSEHMKYLTRVLKYAIRGEWLITPSTYRIEAIVDIIKFRFPLSH